MAIESSIDLFNHIRSEYIARWLSRVEEVRRSGALVAVEAPLLGSDGAPVPSERGGFPYRADLVARDAAGVPRQVSCIFSQVEKFKPVRFNHDGSLPLTVFPFFWTAVPVRVQGADNGGVRRHVAAWAERWYGLVDRGSVESIPEDGLHGVIHRLQYLEKECSRDCVAVEIDLGSAHIESLMTLLDGLKECGAREVRVGDPDLAES